MTKTQVDNEIKNIYEASNYDLEKTLQECLQKGLVKSKKQLISKLVYMRIYQKQEKPELKKEKTITKKDIIAELEQITGLALFDLIEAKKEGLFLLLDWIKDLVNKYRALEVDYTEAQEVIERLEDESE